MAVPTPKIGRKRLVFIGKSTLLARFAQARQYWQGVLHVFRTTRRTHHKNVQNRHPQLVVASLLRNELLMSQNNYPQTYPRVENMLVNTNNRCGTPTQPPRAK